MTRVGLLVEGGLGDAVMGHDAFATSLRIGASARPGVVLDEMHLPRFRGLAAQLTREIPKLRDHDLDGYQARYLMTASVQARRLLTDAIGRDADVLCVVSHAIGMFATGLPAPVALLADVSIWDWRAMGIWRRVRPWSRATYAVSLALERRALERADITLAWSHWTAEGLRRSAPDARIEVLHPGLDLDRFHPRPRSPRTRPRVLFVGGRFEQKGGTDLLDALGPRLGTDIDVDLVTPAELPPRDGVTVHRLGSGDPLLAELYAQADLLALPTYGDAVPWVVLEALASGTPVVGTPIGAIPELIGDAGEIVPLGDTAALAAAVDRLLDDDDRRQRLGELGRAACEARYDARKQAPELLDRLAGIAGR